MRPFTYSRAGSVSEAIDMMVNSTAQRCRYLGGGTTLVDLMKAGVETPGALIDVTDIRGLDQIERDDHGGLVLGALTKMSDVADSPVVRRMFPALSESLWRAASPQLRNMATIGGNVMQRTRCAYFRSPEFACNKRSPGSGCSALQGINRAHAVLGASPSYIAVYPGDWAIALAAFDASIDVVGPAGSRNVSIHDLFLTPGDTPERDTTLEAGELITAIRVPASAAGVASAYRKVRDRESYAFALASAAVGLALTDGVVREARIALGGIATVPWRAREAPALQLMRLARSHRSAGLVRLLRLGS